MVLGINRLILYHVQCFYNVFLTFVSLVCLLNVQTDYLWLFLILGELFTSRGLPQCITNLVFVRYVFDP